MTLMLTIIAVSAVSLLVLLTLYRVEEAHNDRIVLRRVRGFLDSATVWTTQKISYFFGHIGSGVIRVTFQYLLHNFLAFIIKILTKAQGYLSHLQLRNKRIAKAPSEKTEGNHLDAIASYKEEMSLSDEEKRKRRLH